MMKLHKLSCLQYAVCNSEVAQTAIQVDAYQVLPFVWKGDKFI